MHSRGTLLTDTGEQQEVVLRNLSCRGAGIQCGVPLFASQPVFVSVPATFFNCEKVEKKGKIAWCRKVNTATWEAGLDFGLDNKIKID